MSWKAAVGAALILLVIVATTASASVLSKGNSWDSIAGPYGLSIARWELDNLFSKWSFKAEQLLRPAGLTESERVQLVEDHLQLGIRVASLSDKIHRAKSDGQASQVDIASWEAELSTLAAEMQDQEPMVEEIIESQISAVLAEEGFTSTLSLGGDTGFLFPPVDFQFEDRPNLLIVSRRDRIETVDTTLLRADLTFEEIVAIEDEVAAQGFSGLVERIGGVATYPSIVPHMASLETFLSLVAHEWLHHYLFFQPLGQNYWASGNLTTINETVADIAGKEIGAAVYQRFYNGEIVNDVTPADDSKASFDFAAEMRQIRIAADNYLEQGRVVEAEEYMEQKRQFLADNGYYIRKLNQAYFAFHGSYGDSPTSVSPIGPMLRHIREQSTGVGEFVSTVSQISTYSQLLEMADQGSGT
jgi:hypothetical protein